MRQDTYINLQLANIDEAIALGNTVIDSASSLQNRFGDKSIENSDAESFQQDALKYYDVTDALELVEWMPIQLKDFKNQLIEIKIANDKMLLEGGYLSSIDQGIAKIFLSHVLCKMKALDPNTIETIRDALQMLEQLKTELEKIK